MNWILAARLCFAASLILLVVGLAGGQLEKRVDSLEDRLDAMETRMVSTE